MDKLIQKLITRRASKGNGVAQSAALLTELVRSHSGDNLAHALTYNDFATEAGAITAAATLTPEALAASTCKH